MQRGVAQGCPLSPLLYAIFVVPVLQDTQALSHPDLLWVGPAATREKLVGQAYADDLACIAAPQQGLQRVVSGPLATSCKRSSCTAFDGVGCSMCASRLLWCSGRSHCVPDLAPQNSGGVTAVCPPQTQLNTWGSALSQAGAGLLSRRLVLLTDGQRYIGGCRFCAAGI